MKDLIVIGCYCPDDERIRLLNNCVESLKPVVNDFDVMIVSHSIIPDYITKKVDYSFYFKENELITDWKYLNKPWFSPTDNLMIESCFVSNYSTYLAAYSIFLSSLGIAKSLNYQTVHWIEYDSVVNDYTDLYENKELIKDFVAINYKKEYRNYELNLEWGYGCFQTINLIKIPEEMTKYNREYLMDILKSSPIKTNEKITEDLYLSKDETIHYKDLQELLNKGNEFNLSINSEKDSLDYWSVPFWDPQSETLKHITWNNKDYGNINVVIILNDENLITFKNVSKYGWQIKELGNLDDIETITILINGKLKNRITLNDELRELIKTSSYVIHK